MPACRTPRCLYGLTVTAPVYRILAVLAHSSPSTSGRFRARPRLTHAGEDDGIRLQLATRWLDQNSRPEARQGGSEQRGVCYGGLVLSGRSARSRADNAWSTYSASSWEIPPLGAHTERPIPQGYLIRFGGSQGGSSATDGAPSHHKE